MCWPDAYGEACPCLAWRVAGGAADDLHNLSKAGAVSHGQRVFAPDPVEAFFGHAQRNDDVDVIAVVLLCWVFQGCRDFVALGRVVIHQISNTQHAPLDGLHQLEACHRVDALPLTQFLDDVLHLPDLVLGAFSGVHVRDVDDGFLGGVEHLEDVVGVGARVEVVTDVQFLQVLVAVELLVVGVRYGIEAGFVSWC
ncbi:hypothetical protein D3C81_1210250 [compost metagenome]